MLMYNDWRDLHGAVIADFLRYLNLHSSSYVLKGGTSLMLCYGLTRFSEDIDLDALSKNKGIEAIVSAYCTANKFTYRVAKDTDTVKRYLIHYCNDSKPLKVEISYRRSKINNTEYEYINNILVYKITNLFMFKLNAFNKRDKIRDLYDIVFICKNYWGILPEMHKIAVANSFEYKNIDYVAYLLKTQGDELINKEELENDVLALFVELGV